MSDIRLVVLGPPYVGKTSIIKRFLFNTYTDRYKPTMEDLFSKEFVMNGVKIKVDIMDTAGRVEFPAMRRLCISNASAFLFVYSLEGRKSGNGGNGGGESSSSSSPTIRSQTSFFSSQAVAGRGHESFPEIRDCFEEVKEIRGSLKGIPIIFVGNKMDLLSRLDLGVRGRESGLTGLIGCRSMSGGSGDLVSSHHRTDFNSSDPDAFTLDWIDGIEDLHISSTTCSAKTNQNIEQIFTSFLHLYKQITEGNTSSFKRRSSSKSSKNTLQTEEPKSRRSRSLIRRSSRKVKQQVEFIEPECRMV